MPVRGDLALPSLGISDDVYKSMLASIDVIFHCGAFVNSILPYSKLKAANVDGTHEILRMATRVKLKPVHFISTLSVVSSPLLNHANPSELKEPLPKIKEDEPLNDHSQLHEGYALSKWVADLMMLNAATRSLPVTVHR